MDIILLERVEKLGNIGDVVTVKDGFARNFLLPNKKALRANEANKKVFEANRAKIEADNAEKRSAAESHSSNVEGKQVVLIRASSNSGQLYGSVTVRDIAEALNAEGAQVTKQMIVLEHPIKTLGVFDVRVSLHPEVAVNVQVNVARSTDEANCRPRASTSWKPCSKKTPAASPKLTIPTPSPARSQSRKTLLPRTAKSRPEPPLPDLQETKDPRAGAAAGVFSWRLHLLHPRNAYPPGRTRCPRLPLHCNMNCVTTGDAKQNRSDPRGIGPRL